MLDSTVHTLLSIERLYKLTGKELYDFRQNHRTMDSVFKLLPKWTINMNEGAKCTLIEAEYYHQFTIHDDDNEKEYYLFDLSTSDPLLREEISNAGETDLFNEIDWVKLINDFDPVNYDALCKHQIHTAQYAIIQLDYIISHNYEYGDELDDIIVSAIGTINGMDKKLKSYSNGKS